MINKQDSPQMSSKSANSMSETLNKAFDVRNIGASP